MQKNTQQLQKLGGLGANIGNDEWVKARQKKEAVNDFAQNIKLMNQNSIVKRDRPIVVEKPKEKTARDKAMEFAKNNVPKPKAKVKEENENLPKKLYGAGSGV